MCFLLVVLVVVGGEVEAYLCEVLCYGGCFYGCAAVGDELLRSLDGFGDGFVEVADVVGQWFIDFPDGFYDFDFGVVVFCGGEFVGVFLCPTAECVA